VIYSEHAPWRGFESKPQQPLCTYFPCPPTPSRVTEVPEAFCFEGITTMAPPKKKLSEYEAQAVRSESGCLLHPGKGHIARIVYQLRHGAINNRRIAVCHTCDTPQCIEDAHHFLGTWKDNVRDAVTKGRHSCFKNCAKEGEPFRGGPHTQEVKRKIGEASTALWEKVKAAGAKSLAEYKRMKEEK